MIEKRSFPMTGGLNPAVPVACLIVVEKVPRPGSVSEQVKEPTVVIIGRHDDACRGMIHVRELSRKDFSKIYFENPKVSPVEAAIELIEAGERFGITERAKEYLGQFIEQAKKEDTIMARAPSNKVNGVEAPAPEPTPAKRGKASAPPPAPEPTPAKRGKASALPPAPAPEPTPAKRGKATAEPTQAKAKREPDPDMPGGPEPHEGTCGALIRSMIREGASNEEILEAIADEFPESTAKASDISFHKTKMRKNGEDIPRAVRGRTAAEAA